MKEVNYKTGEKVTIACIFGNIVLSALKLAAGVLGGSKAMVADALHSASDIVATSVVLVGIKVAQKPADREHQYGHGKVEPIAAAFVGITLVVAAILIVKGIVDSILQHTFTTPTFLALGAAVVSIIVKEAMFRITYSTGKQINSEAIIADAWHHRSDAYSSIGTFVGILGSIIGGKLGIPFLQYLDPIAGAVVACMIFKVAYDILKHSIKGLMDSAPDSEQLNKIGGVVSEIGGIVSVPDIKARYIGQRLFIDLAIEVDAKISVDEGHTIAEHAKSRIIEHVPDAYDVMVHVEPKFS